MKVAVIIGIVVLLLMAQHFIVINASTEQNQSQPADVIIVLGARGEAGRRRADHAAHLYRQGVAPFIICTGGYTLDLPLSEASEMCQEIADSGVPWSALLLEQQSYDTWQNGEYSVAIMRSYGWKSAVIVSDDYHLLRASMIFKRLGITISTSAAQETAGQLSQSEKTPSTLREVVGLMITLVK